MDFAVPADYWVKLKESEKKDKYLDLARELKKVWNMKVTFISIIIGALVTVTEGLLKGLEDLKIRGRVGTIQTTKLLRSAKILRRVLETWGDLLSLKLQWKTIRCRWCEKPARINTIINDNRMVKVHLVPNSHTMSIQAVLIVQSLNPRRGQYQ